MLIFLDIMHDLTDGHCIPFMLMALLLASGCGVGSGAEGGGGGICLYLNEYGIAYY